jgi:two-component system NtrC family response regulator
MSVNTIPKLLVIDDDEQIIRQLQWALSGEYEVFPACNRAAAVEIVEREGVFLALLDLGLPPHPKEAIEGFQTLEEMISRNPRIKVIVVSGTTDRQNALQAVEKGAHDIFAKPVNLDELRIVLQRLCRIVEMEQETIAQRGTGQNGPFERMIGSSASMKAVFSTIVKVAATDVPVLILGESGTGKELVANAIHSLGARRNGPFGAINCAAIPQNLLESELFGNERGAFTGASTHRRGRLEYARGGTLFLDEIGDLAPELQVKILRFLQEKTVERVGGREPIPVDCRVIAATHQDLDADVRNKRFREDLYFRLAVVRITLPPLRQRGTDILELADHFVRSYSREFHRTPKRFSRAAVDAALHYPWPGNVRELQNRIKRALVLADGPFITPSDLELDEPVPSASVASATLRQLKDEVEREVVTRTLKETGGNISKTARTLGISRPTLYELINRYRMNTSSGNPKARNH